jgi:hypothetical protein
MVTELRLADWDGWWAAVPGKPRTLNEERKGSTMEHRRHTREAREAWGYAWMMAGIPHTLFGVGVTAWPIYPNEASLPDTGNTYPTVKAALDGLVDIGKLAGDDRRHVFNIDLRPPVVLAGHLGMVVRIIETVPHDRITCFPAPTLEVLRCPPTPPRPRATASAARRRRSG